MMVRSNASNTPLTHLQSVVFNRCTMNLRSTTVSAGNLVGNCGVLDVDPNGANARSPTNTGFNIRECVFRNCTVSANTSSGTVSVLLHLVPQGNGNIFTTGATEFANVNRLVIDGGTWTAPGLNTLVNPFTVAKVGEASLAVTTGVYGPNPGLFIRNATIGFAGSGCANHGSPTVDALELFWAAGAAQTQSNWGALAFEGAVMRFSNCDFVNFTQEANAGDLFFRWKQLTLDDVRTTYIAGTTGSAPLQRARFRPRTDVDVTPNPGYARIRRFIANGIDASSGAWTAPGGAYFFLEPWVASFSLSQDRTEFVLEECSAEGFTVAGSPDSWDGIQIATCSPSDFYTGSPNCMRNLVIRNCKISKFRRGFIAVSGIASQAYQGITITGCTITECGGQGILFYPEQECSWGPLIITNNKIVGNGDVNNVPGITITYGDWVGFAPTLLIEGNVVALNNNVSSDTQIHIEQVADVAFPNSYPFGVVCIGNHCLGGTIKTNISNVFGVSIPIAAAWPSGAKVSEFDMRGLETSYSATTTGNRFFTETTRITHNNAILESP
jgi:hypothetical protein